MSQTIIVSNRLPVSVKKGKNGIEVYPSSGGLATGLASYANKRGNLWIGWPGIVSEELTEADKKQVISELAEYNCLPVFLTKNQIDRFYNGYSNSVLWPFFHVLDTDFSKSSDWKAYQEVNELFSESVITASSYSADIWVHDYQLLLLPKLLREHRPNNKIGFFLHIPFPPPEHFETLKQGSSLIQGLLGADLIGFHTSAYANNFVEAASSLSSATPIDNGLILKDRVIRVADFPMGIDYLKFKEAVKSKAVQRELNKLKLRYRGKKIILTVDRLDPTKGFIERLEAYKAFLEETPELHGKVVLIMLAVPSRGSIDAYRQLKQDVETLVKDINKTYRTASWKPIIYMYKSVSFEKLNALYQLADVAFVAPIRDGMNLVAKEYIASQGRSKGMLVLSRTAGAAQELKDALLVNTKQPKTLVKALKKALVMPKKELGQRVTSMQRVIADNTVHDWAGDFMTTLKKPAIKQRTPWLNELRQNNLLKNYEASQKRLILVDYDGVLSPFVDDPKDAAPTPGIKKIISRISKNKANDLAIISGRSPYDLEKWFGDLPIKLIAEHGALIRDIGKEWEYSTEEADDWIEKILPILEDLAAKAPGAFVEQKSSSLVWHYRSSSPYAAQKQIAVIKTKLKPLLASHGLKIFMGNKIIEIKSPNITKGNATKSLLTKPYDFIMAIGDDYTDEDMFRALPKSAFTLKVGPGKTAARYRIQNTAGVQDLLRQL